MSEPVFSFAKLPLYHRSSRNPQYEALVDLEYLPVLQAIGRWSIVQNYGQVCNPPRHIKKVKDPDDGKIWQMCFMLHRTVLALTQLTDNGKEAIELLNKPDGLSWLYDVHSALPKVRQKDGNYFNCTRVNLDAALTVQTEARRKKFDQRITLPSKEEYARFEEDVSVPMPIEELNLSSNEKVELLARKEAGKQATTYEDFLDLLPGKPEHTENKPSNKPIDEQEKKGE